MNRNKTSLFSKRVSLKECNIMRGLLRQWYGREYAENEIIAYQNKAVSLADRIEKVAENALSPGMVKFAKICNEWPEIVGKQLAVFIAPVALQGKLLLIEVNHSAWLREMNGKPGEMIKDKLTKKYPEAVSEIRFVPAGRRQKN